MKAFLFPLERALDWRRLQLELEENRFRTLAAALAELDRARAGLEADAIRAELQVRAWAPLAGRDLAALACFRAYVHSQQRTLASRRAACQREFEAQHKAMLEARRRCRLLENLRQRRWAEWQRDCDRETEQLAAECYLAGIVRRRS